MQKLTDAGENLVNDLSNRYNLSRDAVIHMLIAVNNGGLSMAQFNCPELGGSGQWMQGGMTMVGDMFNNGLKSTVDNLCNELATGLSTMQIFPVIPAGTPGSNQWWPVELGVPTSSGAQNNTRYAVFTGKLAVQVNGQVSVYDTLNHHISGVSQQQGGDDSLTFSSQFGTISVNQLPKIFLSDASDSLPMAASSDKPDKPDAVDSPTALGKPDALSVFQSDTNFLQPSTDSTVQPEQPEQIDQPIQSEQNFDQANNQEHNSAQESNTPTQSADDAIELIGKLAKLRDAGALTDEDFDNKKAELLARI